MSTDCLDRVEAILSNVAESQAASAQRLDCIEVGLECIWQVCESNAWVVEAWGDRIEEGIAEDISSSMAANTNRRVEEAITYTVQIIADMS